ncbi:uncharacterized protein LOC121408708 [Lytechinus variegatus]|uniref:uncharacterized protein LOC121408708 n=1 Tax=Lytechinus variegatus TaxID=7654 RepID=UPI001BB279D9|nr:uncharacterized protein LOC121408708 [Lytechinus variegatus]
MAASMKSKFCDRLEVQDRFRINLESIINKYDKPFEDSPILDLDNMSSDSDFLKSCSPFTPFGRTPLATDLQKGKKRKGGVSGDSALGSTLSPSKSNESSDEELAGNIYLENYDFTHENSDHLGAFIRYRHHSMLNKPEIAGLKRAGREYGDSQDSDDDLGSVCSGPTVAPFTEENCQEMILSDHADMIDEDRIETVSDGGLQEQSPKDKVKSWLSDDAFMNTSHQSNMDDASDVSFSELDESSQESELQSTQSDDETSQDDKGKSLLEIKERFVRKVQSMLVEGNNESEDISSSADENVVFVQGVAVGRTERQSHAASRNVHVNGDERGRSDLRDQCKTDGSTSRRLFKAPLSSTICHEDSSHRGNLDFSTAKPVTLRDETTIIAGHIDDGILSLSRCEDEDRVGPDESKFGRCFELLHSPAGKMEWTPHQRNSSTKKSLPFSFQQLKDKRDFIRGSQSSSCVTPKKTLVLDNLPIKANTPRATSESAEVSQDVISEIMDFFKSPLPKLLTSPMPILSPKGRLRTAHGKPVTRSSFPKSSGAGMTTSSAIAGDKSASIRPSGIRSFESTDFVSKKSSASQSHSSNCNVLTENRTKINQGSSRSPTDSTSYTSKQPHGVQETDAGIHSDEQSFNTDEEEDILLLTASSNEESMTSPKQSVAKASDLSQNQKTPTQSSNAAQAYDRVSRTPGISSPFSHMSVNSAEKHQPNPRHSREKGIRDKLSHPPKTLVFSESKSLDGLDRNLGTELLVLSSDDEEEDDYDNGMHSKIEQRAGKPEMGNLVSCKKPPQNIYPKSASQVDAMENHTDAKNRIESKHVGNHAFDSVEELSFITGKVTNIPACKKISQFEETYIVRDGAKKSSIPHKNSPSRNKTDRDRQWLKERAQRSRSPGEFKLPERRKEGTKSNELEDKNSRSHRVKDGNTCSTRMDSTKKIYITHSAIPMKIKDSSHRHEEDSADFQKYKMQNGVTYLAKDRQFNSHMAKGKHQRHHSDISTERSDATFTINCGWTKVIPTTSRKEISHRSQPQVTRDIPSALTEENRSCRTPKAKYSSVSKNSIVTCDKSEDNYRSNPISKPTWVNDRSSHIDVQPISSRPPKLEDRDSCSTKATKYLARDVSFLSSTRIDEDEAGNKDIRLSRKNHEEKRVPQTQKEIIQDKSLEAKTVTPSKRRRPTSDRTNSQESPAKKQVSTRISPRRERISSDRINKQDSLTSRQISTRISPRRERTSSDRTYRQDPPTNRQVSTKISPQRERIFLDRACRRRIADRSGNDRDQSDDSVSSFSVSSMCEGPDVCTKKICFRCAMKD